MDPDKLLAVQIDISSLTNSVKKNFLYKHNYDVTPVYENQIQYFSKIEFFHRLRAMEQTDSPSLVTPKADSSSAVSPWLGEPGCSTPTRTTRATVSNQTKNLTSSLRVELEKK